MNPQTVEEEAPTREDLIKDCLKAWNKLVRNLLVAEKCWNDYSGLRLKEDIGLEDFDLEAQQVLYLMNPVGDFGLILEDIATHPNVTHFLETLIVKV